MFAPAGVAFPPYFTVCQSFAFAFELMAQSDALMGVPAPLFAGPLNRGRLVKIPLKRPVPPFVVGLCTRANAQMTPVAAALVRAIADVTQRMPRAR